MQDELSHAEWRKSSYSGNSGNCVEVADLGAAVAVRDSKGPNRSVLVVTRGEWQMFIEKLNTTPQR